MTEVGVSEQISSEPTTASDPTRIEIVLEGLGLRRSTALDPAPPPTPVARLAGEALGRLESRWSEMLSFDAATSNLPEGEDRAPAGKRLAASWATIARACAVAVYCSGGGEGPPLSTSERLDATLAAIGLAALAAAHDAQFGFFSIAKLPEHLLRLAQEDDLPAPLLRAAQLVANGRLVADREGERALLELLCSEPALVPSGDPAVGSDSTPPKAAQILRPLAVQESEAQSQLERASEASHDAREPSTLERGATSSVVAAAQPSFPPSSVPSPAVPVEHPATDLTVSWDRRLQQVMVDQSALTDAHVEPLEEQVLMTVLQHPAGIIGAQELGRMSGTSPGSARGAYSTLARRLHFQGRAILDRSVGRRKKRYGLASGFVAETQ